MSEKNRKVLSGTQKAKIALEAVKEHKTMNEIAQEYGVHPTQIITGGQSKHNCEFKFTLNLVVAPVVRVAKKVSQPQIYLLSAAAFEKFSLAGLLELWLEISRKYTIGSYQSPCNCQKSAGLIIG